MSSNKRLPRNRTFLISSPWQLSNSSWVPKGKYPPCSKILSWTTTPQIGPWPLLYWFAATSLSSSPRNLYTLRTSQTQLWFVYTFFTSFVPKIEFLLLPKIEKRQSRVFLLSDWIWIGMVVLPVVKLGTLVLKTLSKPLANRLKHQAAVHPRFRKLIIDLAQVLIYTLLISFYQLGLAWI